MLEKLLEEQKSRLRHLEMGLFEDKGIDPEPQTKSNPLGGFPKKASRVDQAIYFIKREGRPLQLREIVTCMAEISDDAAQDPRRYGNSLSAFLSQGMERGRIKRYSLPRKRGGWYFPNSWADENGELLDGYKKMID